MEFQRDYYYGLALEKYDDLNRHVHLVKKKAHELGKVPVEQFWKHLKVAVQFFEYKLQIRRKYEELRRLLEDCRTYSFLLKEEPSICLKVMEEALEFDSEEYTIPAFTKKLKNDHPTLLAAIANDSTSNKKMKLSVADNKEQKLSVC